MIFNKLKINGVTLKNRIAISPMCQYSAIDGSPSSWHYTHLQNLSSSGASLIILESTAVSKAGRISSSDLCLYNNIQKKNLKKLITFLRKNNDIKFGIQLSHAGRKGSSFVPWIKRNCALPKKKSWQTLSASDLRRDKGWPKPKTMSKNDINNLIKDFKKSTIKAKKINFDCLEIHMAHGYLLHQFFSPISNKRNDMYGGSYQNRSRLLLEIAKEVRKIWPKKKILGARITGTDHLESGIKIQEAIMLSKELKKIGFDYVSVTSGGILPKTKMKQYEGFRTKMTTEIKTKSKIITTTTGMLTNHSFVNNLINKKKLDFITIARIIVRRPTWIYELAKKNKLKKLIPQQYQKIL